MRKRLTNKKYSSTFNKRAEEYENDVYRMNTERKSKDHEADDWKTGDPSDFGEEVNMEHPWKKEKRDPQTNMPVASKKAALKLAKKKAELGLKIAELMLPGADEDTIDEQVLDLMSLPVNTLASLYDRTASNFDRVAALSIKVAEDVQLPEDGAAPAAEMDSPSPLEEEGAADLASGEDMPEVEGEESPSVEDALTEAKEALETVTEVLDEIKFDDAPVENEAAESADEAVLASIFDKNVNVKAASKKTVNKAPSKKTASTGDSLLDKLFAMAPDVKDVFGQR